MAIYSLPPKSGDLAEQLFALGVHLNRVAAANLRPRTIPVPDPLPSVAQAWEELVADLADMDLVTEGHCAFCEGQRGVQGVLEHARGCTFDSADHAVARARKAEAVR